jgi:uncharacterized membrane protein
VRFKLKQLVQGDMFVFYFIYSLFNESVSSSFLLFTYGYQSKIYVHRLGIKQSKDLG